MSVATEITIALGGFDSVFTARGDFVVILQRWTGLLAPAHPHASRLQRIDGSQTPAAR